MALSSILPLRIVLYQPEIPPNTGNVARTCAAIGASLHLIEPLGFSIADAQLKRAGLDYWHMVQVHRHADWDSFEATCASDEVCAYLTTKAVRPYTEIPVRPLVGHTIVFGPETRGLPDVLLDRYPQHLYRIPMVSGARSLNLGNSVAIVAYDIVRRAGFPGLR